METSLLKTNANIVGEYRLLDATPDSEWSQEDRIRFFKKNIAATAILIASVGVLFYPGAIRDLQVLGLTLAGSASSVLLNGEQKQIKK